MVFDTAQSPPEPKIYPRDQHHISRNDIDPDALKTMYRLIQGGYKAYLVGGAVRDILLNKIPKDFDIATDATPQRVKSLFRNSRIIGRRFKLVQVYFRDRKIMQVSTFRDVSEIQESDPDSEDDGEGKQPIADDNIFGTEATDAQRRDITINGLFYDLSTFSIIDYVGGVRDLQARIIKVIGDPDVRFDEDPVRMLRVIRHSARSGFRIDDDCLGSILTKHAQIENAPPMRLFEEVKKDLCCGYFLGILRLLASCRLLPHLLPELSVDEAQLLHDGTYFSASLARCDHMALSGVNVTPTSVLMLIALFASSHKSMVSSSSAELRESFTDETALRELVEQCFPRLAVPRRERERVESALALWFRITHPGQRPRRNPSPETLTDLELLLQFLADDVGLAAIEDLTAASADEDEDAPPHRRRRRRRSRRGRGGAQ